MGRELRVGLLGLGTVGSGVIELLHDNAAALRRRLGAPVRVVTAAVRSKKRRRDVDLSGIRLTTDADRVVRDPEVDVVVELIGGTTDARRLVLDAIAAGKDVVTANKALLATHGAEVFAAAETQRVRLGFEASVAGGVPIIRTLKESLAGDHNRRLVGIVNGTCNWILSAMSEEGAELSNALAAAQRLGLAEADPTLDIEGIDAAQKLQILITLAFGVSLTADSIPTEGIRGIEQVDVAYARELGFGIKLLAIAEERGRSIEARVHPAMVPDRHLLADVRGATNAIEVRGDALGASLYVGAGAGKMPTAMAVLGDVVEIGRERFAGAGASPPLGTRWSRIRQGQVRPLGQVETEYYLRFAVRDRPGVLARIAGILGEHSISIASVLQTERAAGAPVPIVIRTHEAREDHVSRALAKIAKLADVRAKPVRIRVEESKEMSP